MTRHADAMAWLARLRAEHGIDGSYDATRTWPFRIGPLTIPVPNFSWRRAAIQRHDLHHILNGFPFNMRGEFQVATWEFAAGRYPHPGASLLLLPLVTLGLFWSPRAIWRAFMMGRYGTSFYRPDLLELDLAAIRALRPSERQSRPATARDVIAFAGLLIQSIGAILLPAASLFLLAMLSF
ncbi:hypothetical protein [Dongia sp.]|uniref:hypothetical protein n=1 Tax=Dongia sp. TaxID=1977262 RepID=UPI003753B7DD